jgi:hypothetical protein
MSRIQKLTAKLTVEEILEICREKYEAGIVFKPIYGNHRGTFTSAGVFKIHDREDYNICVLVIEKSDTDDNTVSVFSNEMGYALIIENQTTLSKIQDRINFLENLLNDE